MRVKKLRFEKVEMAIAMIAFSILVLITLLGVWFRRVMNSPLPWLEEVQLLLIIWTSFLGASVALKKQEHMFMDFFYDMFHERCKSVADIVAYLIMTLLMVFFCYQSVCLIIHYSKAVRTSSILRIPAIAKYGVIPLSTGAMALRSAINLSHSIFKIRSE